jgi:peptidoglycan/LPS O-acetylase OafA/YrhL
MHSDSHNTHYRPDIDGLRAFSILSVIIYHAFPQVLPGGFVGVDIFFVISGYLITSIITKGVQQNDFSLIGFYRRRVQRIFPALAIILLSCLLIGWFTLLPAEMAMLGKHTAAASIFIPNFSLWLEAGYFDTSSELKPLLHLWSLGVEEQFYLLWPVLLLLASRWRLKLLAVLSTLFLASFAINILLAGDDSAASFYLPQFRAWELLLGAFLTLAPSQKSATHGSEPAWLPNAISVFGLVLMVTATMVIDRSRVFPGWWAVLPTGGAALIIFAGSQSVVSRFLLSHPLLVWIGKISFPLYLWHWPLLAFARVMEAGEIGPELRLLILAVSVALSWLTYRYLEKPLRYNPRPLVPLALIAATLSLGALGYGVYRNEGFPARHADLLAKLAPFEWAEDGNYIYFRDDCSQQLEVPGRCFSNGLPHSVAVLGDSHSTNIFYAVEEHYKGQNIGVVRMGLHGCPPLYDVQSLRRGEDWCRKVSNDILDHVISKPELSTVFLSTRGTNYLPAGNSKPRYKLHYSGGASRSGGEKAFRQSLDKTLRKLLKAGKKVVYVMEWPDLEFDPRSCVDARPLRLSKQPPRECHIPIQQFRDYDSAYRKAALAVLAKHPRVKIWDTHKAFCNKSLCVGIKGDRMLYRDHSHLSVEGSRYLGRQLRQGIRD